MWLTFRGAGQDDFEVGYGKPPKHTRFMKGQSGNPKGRKKGSASYKSIIAEAFAEPITITVNSERKTMTKREAITQVLMGKALKGDMQALRLRQKLLAGVEEDRMVAEQYEVDVQKTAARARKMMGAKD